MDNNCCNKKTKRNLDEKKLITNRLNRISGQINGINRMIENDAYCNDVLIQLSAVENAVKSLSTHILENHLYTCVARDLENGNLDTIDELISLFKRFNK
ncbi:MAG: metal-sensing transcriptional repressor [Ruminococcaceae bacterium]|nr:metal-sensing transcriptional repressor [Oscillospiraceae bacterium]